MPSHLLSCSEDGCMLYIIDNRLRSFNFRAVQQETLLEDQSKITCVHEAMNDQVVLGFESGELNVYDRKMKQRMMRRAFHSGSAVTMVFLHRSILFSFANDCRFHIFDTDKSNILMDLDLTSNHEIQRINAVVPFDKPN